MVKLFRFLFVCAVLLAIAGCGLIGVTLWYFGRDLPDYQQLAHYQPPIMTRVHAGDGRLLAEYATERRVFVPIQAIPKPVINAFLAAEDKNFYSHHGIDPVSIVRAAITDVGRFRANRRPVGASTITQQVAKNMLLSSEISIERKIKEILLATRIEAALPKDRILELYLNEIYLGAGAYGVAAAAQTYFDKSLDELTLGEAAFLAGLPKAPNRYNPARHPEAAKARRDWVLDRMVEDGTAAPETVVPKSRQLRSNCGIGGRRSRSRRPISPRRSGASCSPATARRCCTAAGCRCAPASMRGCRRQPTGPCAPGSSPMSTAMAAGAARWPASIRKAIGRRISPPCRCRRSRTMSDGGWRW